MIRRVIANSRQCKPTLKAIADVKCGSADLPINARHGWPQENRIASNALI
jgi:hypothetical protein